MSNCQNCTARSYSTCAAMTTQQQIADLSANHRGDLHYASGQAIYHQGDAARGAYTVKSGWVCLHQTLKDGRRQIVGFVLPGEVIDISNAPSRQSHAATALTDSTLCLLPTQNLEVLTRAHVGLNRRRLWMLMRAAEVWIDQLAALGQQNAVERTCHLLYSLAARMKRRAPCDGDRFNMPLTQSIIAESLGLTSIHVNRTLRILAAKEVLSFKHGVLTVMNARAFAQQAEFPESLGDLWSEHAQSLPGAAPADFSAAS